MLMLSTKKQQLAIDPMIEKTDVIKNRPFKILQLHAHYKDGFTICIALVELPSGKQKAYEFKIEGFDMHDYSIQKGIQSGVLCHEFVTKKIFQ